MSRPRSGALEFRGGKWSARLTVTVDGESIRKRFDLGTDNKAVARRKLARMLREGTFATQAEAAVEAAKPETYAELAARVAKRRRANGLKDCTSEEARERIWILPEIGQLAVAEIKAAHIEDIYDRATAAGKSQSHLRNLRTVMQSRFKRALAEEIIAKDPVSKAEMKKAKEDNRERAVLTNEEFARYLAWQHPLEQHRLGDLERQTMSAIARMFGGLRTGDLHHMRWSRFDVGEFTHGKIHRRKTERDQEFIVPDTLRPVLLSWRMQQGSPRDGLVFPALRGKNAGEGAKRGVSHADAMRRDLRRAFGIDVWNAQEGKFETVRELTDRERELLEETEFTRPVDFHSWRRAYCQALANAGMSAQQAQKLAGHASLTAPRALPPDVCRRARNPH